MSAWKQRIAVAWGIPRHGWLPLHIEDLAWRVSLCINLPFLDLESAMESALVGETRPARLYLEPAVLEVRFEADLFSVHWFADDRAKEGELELPLALPLERQIRAWLRAFENFSQAYQPEWELHLSGNRMPDFTRVRELLRAR